MGIIVQKSDALLPKEEKAEGEIGRIIEKCISWEPDDRYSAGELIETLKEFIHA